MMFEQPLNIPAYDEKESLDAQIKQQLMMKLSQNKMSWDDFDDAPDWATCVVLNKVTNTFAWSDSSMYVPILRNPPQAIHKIDDFEIIAKRPADPAPDVTVTRVNDDRLQQCFTLVTNDNVNHPDHYTRGGIECIDAITAATVGKTGIEAICVANIIKYLWRYELKNGVEDIKKARWYLNKLLEVKIDER
ncbi:TPA: DUF3310 domain-containing protein [Salmonella enterica subsp. enterica serovar Javiana]